MTAVLLVVAAAWAAAALVAAQRRAARSAAVFAALAALHAAAAAWQPAAALLPAAWLGYALTVPGVRAGSAVRRVSSVAAGVAGLLWAGACAVAGRPPDGGALAAASAAVLLLGAVAVAARCRHADRVARRELQWLAAGGVLAGGYALVVLALHVLIDVPDDLAPWLVAALVLVPVAQALALAAPTADAGETALVESIVVTGVAGLVVAVYLVVVVGLNRVPVGGEREVLVASIVAAMVVAILVLPVRQRLLALATGLVGRPDVPAEQALATFGARMSRAVPMDELMLQLAESLRATVAPAGAEIWVGADGVLARTVSVPTRPPERIPLAERERVVVGRARIGGPSWSSVWLPSLVEPGHLRVAPMAHLGELLGLVVVRRPVDDDDYTDEEERQLVELARQLGLALHNVRLDSALQASLQELEQRNAELRASRLRIVTASDESRRAIERNLHDGAQQHLVALAVKLGLAQQIAEDDPQEATAMLAELRDDVRTTIAELRELAHGIYPPLLRDQGLGEALGAAAARSPLPCAVRVDLPGRYPQEVETAAYFCCLEALQNAGKHAGPGARITVTVGADERELWFEVRDDGAGFAPSERETELGHGFVNMQDRLGAIGGRLEVRSAPGTGTTVRGCVPGPPLQADVSRRADPSAVAG